MDNELSIVVTLPLSPPCSIFLFILLRKCYFKLCSKQMFVVEINLKIFMLEIYFKKSYLIFSFEANFIWKFFSIQWYKNRNYDMFRSNTFQIKEKAIHQVDVTMFISMLVTEMFLLYNIVDIISNTYIHFLLLWFYLTL